MSISQDSSQIRQESNTGVRQRKGAVKSEQDPTMVPRVLVDTPPTGEVSTHSFTRDVDVQVHVHSHKDDGQRENGTGSGRDTHARYKHQNGAAPLGEIDTRGQLYQDDEEEVEIETSFTEPLLSRDRTDEQEEEEDAQRKARTDESWSPPKSESSFMIAAQVSLPFLIAGCGTVFAGLVLDHVQHWQVFETVTEVFILVPALLGLKGNLEMTLASRLSTQANLGAMDEKGELQKMILGNMALTQCQAIVVGFLASVAAVLFGWIPDGEFNINDVLLLCASSLVTASLASAILGGIMVGVICVSRKCKINPDNVATPIAASLGDLITLSLLAWISNVLFKAVGKQHWLAPTIIGCFLLLVPIWALISHRNKYTREVLYSGWSPVIVAMVISSIGGLVLDIAIRGNEGVAVFSPVINGVGGNLVAVQASRISTYLHGIGSPGTQDPDRIKKCNSPFTVFFGKDMHSRSARVLIMMVIPGQLIFLYFISFVKAGHTSITLRVTIMYLSVALFQVITLLQIADWLVYYLWRKKLDPDNFSIPYLTALGDLLGTALLALGFYVVWTVGDRDVDIGD